MFFQPLPTDVEKLRTVLSATMQSYTGSAKKKKEIRGYEIWHHLDIVRVSGWAHIELR